MASEGPGRLTTRKVRSGGKVYEYWCCFWRNSSNRQKNKDFGNVKKVTRQEAMRKCRLWVPTWTRDPVPDDYRTKTITVDELADRYIAWVKVEHPDKPCPDPSQKGTYRRQIIDAINYLRPYGNFRAVDFRPRMLREIRDGFVKKGWRRKGVNGATALIVKAFRWASERELIPPESHSKLRDVEPLKRGRTKARERKKVKPVDWATVKRTMEFCRPEIRALIELHWETGMRPSEVTRIRRCDLDMSNPKYWVYRPPPYEGSTAENTRSHKADDYHDEELKYAILPAAQAIITPLMPWNPQDYLFRPANTNRKKPHITPRTYWRAVNEACRRAFPAPEGLDKEQTKQWHKEHHWHPHQLRHSAGTRFRAKFGLDITQALLGHLNSKTTEIYAEVPWDQAVAAVVKIEEAEGNRGVAAV